jgi:hypothetical protein
MQDNSGNALGNCCVPSVEFSVGDSNGEKK